MKITFSNHYEGESVYFDTFSDAGRDSARLWHEKSGKFYNDRPRMHGEAWYDAKGDHITDIEAYNQKMDYHFGYIYDLLVTLHHCKTETEARKKARETVSL